MRKTKFCLECPVYTTYLLIQIREYVFEQRQPLIVYNCS